MPQGFLLTRHSFDQRGSTCIHYWLATPEGPAKLVIEGERPVFMVKVGDRVQVQQVLAAVPHEWQQLGFQTFGREEAAMLYFPTIDAHRQAQTVLNERGIEVFEGRFHPPEISPCIYTFVSFMQPMRIWWRIRFRKRRCC